MRVACVGAVARDAYGRLLVIQRAHPPAAGTWSLPGGRVEAGETLVDAVRREVFEETGLHVHVGEVIGVVELAGTEGALYVVTDFAARVTDSCIRDPIAGDDARDARWVSRKDFDALPTSPGLAETLASWGIWD